MKVWLVLAITSKNRSQIVIILWLSKNHYQFQTVQPYLWLTIKMFDKGYYNYVKSILMSAFPILRINHSIAMLKRKAEKYLPNNIWESHYYK